VFDPRLEQELHEFLECLVALARYHGSNLRRAAMYVRAGALQVAQPRPKLLDC
jgi:hypothetical protein